MNSWFKASCTVVGHEGVRGPVGIKSMYRGRDVGQDRKSIKKSTKSLKTANFVYILSVILISHYAWGLEITKACAIFLGIVSFYYCIRWGRSFIRFGAWQVFIAAWLTVASISCVASGANAGELSLLLTAVEVIGISMLVYLGAVWMGSITFLGGAFLAVAICSFCLTKFGVLGPTGDTANAIIGGFYDGRMSGTVGNPNLYGYLFLIGLVFLLYLWRTLKRRWNVCVLLLVLGGICLTQLVNSGSRKAIFGFCFLLVVEFLFLLFSWRDKRYFQKLVIGLTLLVFAGGSFGVFILTSPYAGRIRNVLHLSKGERLEGGEGSLYGRLSLAMIGLNSINKNPVIGSGLGSFRGLKPGRIYHKGVGTYSHSNFVEIMVSTGLVGFLLYYSIYGIMLLKVAIACKGRPNALLNPTLRFAIMGAMLCLLYDMFSVTYYAKESWYVLAVVLASGEIAVGEIRGKGLIRRTEAMCETNG